MYLLVTKISVTRIENAFFMYGANSRLDLRDILIKRIPVRDISIRGHQYFTALCMNATEHDSRELHFFYFDVCKSLRD